MPPTKRARAGAAARHAKPKQQKGIGSFGTISKAPTSPIAGTKKRRANFDDEEPSQKKQAINVITTTTAPTAKPKRKREASPTAPDTTRATKRERKNATNDAEKEDTMPRPPLAPSTPRTKRQQISKPAETPTRGALRLFAGLNLDRSCPLPSPGLEDDTPPTSPCSSNPPASSGLPGELHDLVHLNRSFLSALSLHYAHNGTSSPVDLRILTPSITKIWGKRKVVFEDIQRCLAILQSSSSSEVNQFHLSDYGHRKYCIEISASSKNGRWGVLPKPIDEGELNAVFEREAYLQWRDFCSSRSPASQDAPTFIAGLPLASIALNPSVLKANMLQKGQRRLEELKAGPRKTTTPGLAPSLMSEGKENAPPASAMARTNSLLDRILAKQNLAASAPAPPSPAELARLSALHRASDVLSIIQLLATQKGMPGQRVGFSVAQLVQSVQGSVRNVMSKEEIERTVKVLAEEVCVGYIGMVNMGSVRAVVVNQAMRPSATAIKDRIKVLCGQ